MRITGGKEKGRKISVKTPSKVSPLRPTASKVREAIFNIIGDDIKDSHFLDLYAGTGAVGMEALSRGAQRAVFVEINPIRCRLIKDITSKFGYKDKTRIYKMEAFKYLQRARERREVFDYIFIDPPYQSQELMKILPLLSDGLILSEDGIIIIEHFSRVTLPEDMDNIEKIKTYKYGDTSLTTYRLKEK